MISTEVEFVIDWEIRLLKAYSNRLQDLESLSSRRRETSNTFSYPLLGEYAGGELGTYLSREGLRCWALLFRIAQTLVG